MTYLFKNVKKNFMYEIAVMKSHPHLFSLCAGLVGWILTANTAFAGNTNLVNMSGVQIYRSGYASDGLATFGGMFDYAVQSLVSGSSTTGFFNAAVDLDLNASISADEWIVRNAPVYLDDGLIYYPKLSAWFDPGVHDIIPGQAYTSYSIIAQSDVTDINDLSDWYSSQNNAGNRVWGGNDPSGQQTSGFASSGNATSQGKFALPLRKGVPDIAQLLNECGPTSAANSLRWLLGTSSKLPASDDTLIRELMKAMTGSDSRPFGGLVDNQLFDGKVKYNEEKNLGLIIKGGNGDPAAGGGKAFDFISSELGAGEDVEFLVGWPVGGSHWVTVIGAGVNGDRLFLDVMDPDDQFEGPVKWELNRNGEILAPNKARAMWAVSESVPAPAPLPLFGVATAFSYAKKLRKYNKILKSRACNSSSPVKQVFD